jgi:hypothetical protein
MTRPISRVQNLITLGFHLSRMGGNIIFFSECVSKFKLIADIGGT